jgi:hypothetical protein
MDRKKERNLEILKLNVKLGGKISVWQKIFLKRKLEKVKNT